MNSARILVFDIEVSPILAWTYGMWKTNVIKIEQNPSIMSISWRWYGEDVTHHESLASIPRKRGTSSNLALVKLIRNLFDEADILVAHNGNKFDIKVVNASFIRYNLTPPSPYKSIDTLQVARSVARFSSNSLNSLCELFGIGTKSDVSYKELWYDCLQGKKEAWEQMKIYNNQDVDMLYELYERLRPYIKNHTNLGDLYGERGLCPKCGSPKLEKRGVKYGKQTYQCRSCMGWCNDSSKKSNGRIVNA